jgi:hypothetical protein
MSLTPEMMTAMLAAGLSAEQIVAKVNEILASDALLPNAITPETRRAVIARDGLECRYCGSFVPVPHLDHVMPRSRGGQHTADNLVVSCKPCNTAKKDRTPAEWRGA